MLGRALNSFSERKGNADSFISLRESKLTRLLSESFGGNSKTWMLATVSPTAYNAYETISTLDYASNAKAITNQVKVNSGLRSLELKELKMVVSILEKRLENVGRTRDAKQIELARLEEECQAMRAALQTAHSQELIKSKLQSACTRIREGNGMLRKRIEAASSGVMWPLDNIGAPLFFKGRCGISLKSVFLGQKCTFRIPIKADNGQGTTCKLIVQLFPVGENTTECTSGATVVGSDVRFVLHIVGAEGLPPNCSAHALCLVSLLNGKCSEFFSTITSENTTCPNWNYVRQFELGNVTSDIIDNYSSRDLFCFEIFGFSV
ncbi:kinesin [Strigomonas culicis]|uniref:Kinesin n=1 Tax=Strigomonas culicis TaxID=28005 RepID=S9UKH3_9TRYP|nr:kinesin [Strigomonas culicis]|eukprot:EPY31347.1 kinesin [Strigomonas culicis]